TTNRRHRDVLFCPSLLDPSEPRLRSLQNAEKLPAGAPPFLSNHLIFNLLWTMRRIGRWCQLAFSPCSPGKLSRFTPLAEPSLLAGISRSARVATTRKDQDDITAGAATGPEEARARHRPRYLRGLSRLCYRVQG